MQKKLCSFAMLLTFVFSSASFAQSRKTAKDSSVVIIFNESSATRSSKKKKGSSEMNIIKIAPLGVISGQFPILYERSITDFFSIQGGVGLTHRNYIRGAIASSGESDSKYTYPWAQNQYTDATGDIYNFDRRKAALGYMATLQPRIYFGSEGLDGSFIGLSFDYYRYNFNTPGAVASGGSLSYTGPLQKEHENLKDYMVHFGFQSLYERVSLEYTTAIGIRNVDGEKYAAATTSNGQAIAGFARYNDTRLNFGIGIKVGYHF